MFRLYAPTNIAFYVSLALAVFSVVVRLTADTADGYAVLLVGYLVLLLGMTFKGDPVWQEKAPDADTNRGERTGGP